MKIARWITCASLGLALVVAASVARRTSAADDETANLRKQCSAFVAGWNKHDAKAMAAVFASDGDAIDPMGHHAAGRADVEKAFAADHTGHGPMRESTLEIKDEPIRLVTADVAISDADVELSGVYGPDGKQGPPLGVHVTNIWKKTDGQWWIFASRPHLKLSMPPAPATK